MPKLNGLYKTLRLVSHSILRSNTRQELFCQVCQAAVEHGSFLVAVIRCKDPKSEVAVPVAQFGGKDSDLATIRACSDEQPEGQKHFEMVLQTGRTYVSDNFVNDMETDTGCSLAERSGIRASATLAIRLHGEVCGTLTLYASDPKRFQTEEIALLEVATADISYALDKFALEEDRLRHEEVLKRYAAIVESTNDAVLSESIEGTITSWNPAAVSIFGYTEAEAVGSNISILIPFERIDEQPKILASIAKGERIVDYETIRVRKNGQRFPASITITPLRLADG